MSAQGAYESSEDAATPGRRRVSAPQALPPAHADLRRRAEDEAKRGFLRAASHELRTPLNAIIGFSEIIVHELHGPIGEPRYREHAEVVRDSGLKLLKLVNQILEIARLEAGAADLDLRPEPLAPAFADAMRLVADQAAARRVTFDARLDDAVDAVVADTRGLQTALVNLLSNAVAFSPEGGVVRLSGRRQGEWVRIEVADDGPGLTPRDLVQLLRPFSHGEGGSVRGAEGAGLGLTVVNLLCRGMGGRLRLHSAEGRGLTASMRLPAARHA
jgi:signal transduction histidine kinase